MADMSEEELTETPISPLSADSVRRRFTAATWGSAAGYVVLAFLIGLGIIWLLDFEIASLLGPDGMASLIAPAALVVYLARDAMKEVRKEQRYLARRAHRLVSAAQEGTDLHNPAYGFGLALLDASTAFNTRVLPRRAARDFARQVNEEAKAGALQPATLRVVERLARQPEPSERPVLSRGGA